jgi:hypothetical protein
MGTRRWILLCGLMVCAWLVTQMASPLRGQPNNDTAKSAASPTASEGKELRIRYAEAHLKLMEARLAEFEAINRRNPNTIRPAAIQLIQEYVAKARERLKATQSDEPNDSRVHVVAAEAELRLVDEKLRRAEEVHRRLPNSVTTEEIARIKAERDLAKIKLETASHMASESPLTILQFEMDALRADVQELRLLETMRRIGS